MCTSVCSPSCRRLSFQTKHRHRPFSSIADEHRFAFCVNSKRCEPRAHGNVMLIEECSRCGAIRITNFNAGAQEWSLEDALMFRPIFPPEARRCTMLAIQSSS